ncbi:MAG: dolichyl-diphosphooligosaccharide--protein glycosyltransferase subunit STT3 [Magnetococcus sp. WYHC-3]
MASEKLSRISKNRSRTQKHSSILSKPISVFCWRVFYWVFLCVLFLGLAVLFSWPLSKDFAHTIIGQRDFTDGPFFMWNLWWVKKAFSLGLNPLFTNYVYYPAYANLTLHTFTFTSAILAWPILRFFSLISSLNILLFFSMVATGVGMCVLIYYLTRNRYAGIISGIIFTFSPNIFAHLMAGHYNLGMLWPFPWIVLFFLRMLREESRLNAVAFALFLSAQFYLDLQMSSAVGIILIVIFIGYAISSPQKTFSLRRLQSYTIALAIFLAFFLVPYLRWMNGFLKVKFGEETYNNGDLAVIFGSNPLSSLFGGGKFELISKMVGSYRENTISLGLTVIATAILSFAFCKDYIREKIIFFVLAALGIILALGPNLQINDIVNEKIKLPFYYLSRLPLFNVGVVPSRYIVIAFFALAVLAGFFCAGVLSRLKFKYSFLLATAFILVVCGLVSLEYYSAPLKVDKIEVSPIYSRIAAEKGNFTVLPAFAQPRDAYFQTVHSKKVVSGYLSRRVHKYYLMQYAGVPGIRPLVFGDLNQFSADDLNRSKVVETYKKYEIKYVICDKTTHNPSLVGKVKRYLGDTLKLPVYAEDEMVVVYQVDNQN